VVNFGFCNEVGAETIIYKRSSRGSLDSYLSDMLLLTWVKRLEISVGVAHALRYIHYDEPPYECLNEEQSQRPNMDEIVTKLEKALELQLECENAEHSSVVAEVGGTSSSHGEDSASHSTSTGVEHQFIKKTMSSLKYLSHTEFSFEDIESATNNFAPENVIRVKTVKWFYQGRMLHSGHFHRYCCAS
nr:protein kinase-like domain, phloem protein 2-like protein [Tanacetum cinerariifolium]